MFQTYMAAGWLVCWMYFEFIRDYKFEDGVRKIVQQYPEHHKRIVTHTVLMIMLLMAVFWPMFILGRALRGGR